MTRALHIEIPSHELVTRNANIRPKPQSSLLSPPLETRAEAHLRRTNSTSNFDCFRTLPRGSFPVSPEEKCFYPPTTHTDRHTTSSPMLESNSPGAENMPILVETDVCSTQCQRLQLPQLTPPHFTYHYLSHSESRRCHLPSKKRPRLSEEPLDLSKKTKS